MKSIFLTFIKFCTINIKLTNLFFYFQKLAVFFVIVGGIFLSFNFALAAVISQTQENSYQEWGNDNIHIRNIAQSFEFSENSSINSINVKLIQRGFPIDDIFITIRGDNNGVPRDSILATSNIISSKDLLELLPENVFHFSFLLPFEAQAFTKYWFVMERTTYSQYPQNFIINRYNASGGEDIFSGGELGILINGVTSGRNETGWFFQGNDMWFEINTNSHVNAPKIYPLSKYSGSFVFSIGSIPVSGFCDRLMDPLYSEIHIRANIFGTNNLVDEKIVSCNLDDGTFGKNSETRLTVDDGTYDIFVFACVPGGNDCSNRSNSSKITVDPVISGGNKPNVISQTISSSWQEWGTSPSSSVSHTVNISQSFQYHESLKIDSINVKLSRYHPNINDNVYITIRDDNNGKPGNTILSQSNLINGANIKVFPNESVANFKFAEPYKISPFTKYWFVMERRNYIEYSTLDFYLNRHNQSGVDYYKNGELMYLISNVWHQSLPSDLWFEINMGGIIPPQFFSQVQNRPTGKLNIHINTTPSSETLKTIPNGWVVKVLATTDINGNTKEVDGYRWYYVQDMTDNTIGWVEAKNLADSTIYLDYDANNQNDLQNKAETQLDTVDKRKPVILDAVNNYHSKNNSDNSLYGGGGGLDNRNNFQKFIQGSSFPKELILAISAQESGPNFNNEIVSFDYGHGAMQITFQASTTNALANKWDNREIGSSVSIPLCKSIKSDEYKKCYANSETINNLLKPYKHFNDIQVNPIYKQYSNTIQSIYSNIKDGFRVLQDKYRQKCPKENEIIDGYTFTCQDTEKILNTWAYNGFIKDKNGNYIWHYLRDVADKLENLNSYFAGIFYGNTDNLIEKLRIADANKQIIKAYSPVELRVIDAQGNITGVVNGQTKEEIKDSLYESEQETIAIFFPENNYKYRLVGKDNGNYGLLANNEQSGVTSEFNARNIPIKTSEIHQYEIDWTRMNSCEQGAVKLQIDYEGDGVFDRTFYSDCDLYDIEPPQISVSPLQNNYLFNSQLQIQFSATDNISGIASVTAKLNGEIISNNQTVILNKPGLNSLEITATDNEWNTATSIQTFNVIYSFGGFLPPVKTDGSGIYNKGRMLPVKFQLTDVNNNFVSTAVARLYIAKIENGIIGSDELPSSIPPIETNLFRYDPKENLYIYNLDTSKMSQGRWQLKAVLDDGRDYKIRVLVK